MKYLIPIALIGLSAIGFVCLKDSSDVIESAPIATAPIETIEVSKEESKEVIEEVSITVAQVVKPKEVYIEPSWRSDDYLKRVAERHEERGTYSKEDKDIYKNYDAETLTSLIEQQDMLAHQVFAGKLSRNMNSVAGGRLLLLSALLGDVNALRIYMHKLAVMEVAYELEGLTKEDLFSQLGMVGYSGTVERAILLKQRSLGVVLQIRGEQVITDISEDAIKDKNAEPFSENEKIYAKNLGFRLYHEMDKQRDIKGFKEFDNSVFETPYTKTTENKMLDEYLAAK